jgi:hypothetical protein
VIPSRVHPVIVAVCPEAGVNVKVWDVNAEDNVAVDGDTDPQLELLDDALIINLDTTDETTIDTKFVKVCVIVPTVIVNDGVYVPAFW